MIFTADREDLVDPGRLGYNSATERYQPHHGIGVLEDNPLDTTASPGVISVIERGPTGVGATYEAAEPLGPHYHRLLPHGAPLTARPAGIA